MINVFHSSLQFLLNSRSCGVAHVKAGDLSGPLGASAGDPLWQGLTDPQGVLPGIP